MPKTKARLSAKVTYPRTARGVWQHALADRKFCKQLLANPNRVLQQLGLSVTQKTVFMISMTVPGSQILRYMPWDLQGWPNQVCSWLHLGVLSNLKLK